MEARLQTPRDPGGRHRRRWTLLAGALVVLLSRALFSPPTLEDIDSVNFALALERFDPRLHQPHPPGYPVYVALARAARLFVPDSTQALALLSALSQAALVLPLFALFRELSPTSHRAGLATVLALACPILWFTGARPMSDSVGLLFVTASQALLLRALAASTSLAPASWLVGLSLGVRLQTGLLTLPLWFFSIIERREWRRPLGAICGGVAVWIVPLMIASGGPEAYARAFSQTMGEAAGSEPLLAGFTLNRAARALVKVVIAPWVSPALGVLVSLLAGVGFVALMRRRSRALLLASLAFLPYLLTHTFVQQVEAVRYSLPYIPLVAWLAIEGVAVLATRAPHALLVERVVVFALLAASASATLPALALYRVLPSPPYAAFRLIGERAERPEGFILAGHHMFSRYFRLRPPGLELLETGPNDVRSPLSMFFRSGDVRPVLFVADPPRTDLMSFSPESRRLLGRWEWPKEIQPFLSAARPNEAEVYELQTPLFFSGQGFLLSLEPGRLEEVVRDPWRDAYVKPSLRPSFLLLSGAPTRDAPGCTLEIDLPGLLHSRESCSQPFFGGYRLAPSTSPAAYLRLTMVSHREGVEASMPFAMEGLAYGPTNAAGWIHGDGWFLPERDEVLRPFRWASPHARSLLHVPSAGARLIVEGVAPLEYVGNDVEVKILDGGAVVASARLNERSFRLEAPFAGSDPPFHEIALTASRSFIPDEAQKNGDRRRLALRIYRFSLETVRGNAQTPAPVIAGSAGPE